MAYDPVKAHEYYEKTKKLKGRKPGTAQVTKTDSTPSKPSAQKQAPKKPSPEQVKNTVARIGRLKSKVKTLEGALSEAQAALSEKRAAAVKTEKKNSDGKSTADEKQSSQEYRDKHKEEIKAKEKAQSKTDSKSSSSSSSSSSTSSSDTSVEALSARVDGIKKALSSAKSQLSSAQSQLGQLSHSAITSMPGFDETQVRPPISRKDSVKMTADFSGYATRNNLRCSDGRTILADAFKDNDGMIVPLLWQHGHNDVENVLGHVKLENRAEGVYAQAFFNETAKGKAAKEQVKHGDIKFLSIWANQLVEQARNVVRGNIREVSLVLAGANPGAYIDNLNIVHGEGDYTTIDSEAAITTGFEIEVAQDVVHATATDTKADDELADKDPMEILEGLAPAEQKAMYFLLSRALTVGAEMAHSEDDPDAVAVLVPEPEAETTVTPEPEVTPEATSEVVPETAETVEVTAQEDAEVIEDPVLILEELEAGTSDEDMAKVMDEIMSEIEAGVEVVAHAATGTTRAEPAVDPDVRWLVSKNATASMPFGPINAMAKAISSKYKFDGTSDKAWKAHPPALNELLAGAVKYLNAQALTKVGSAPSGKKRVEFYSTGTSILTRLVPVGMKHSDTIETGESAVQHDNNQEDTSMTFNAFDQAKDTQGGAGSLMHAKKADGTIVHSINGDDVKSIMTAVVRNNGRLSTEMESYALAHGIENIEYLFPDAKTLAASPAFISRRMEWVDKVLAGVRKAPFARIKTITADITGDEARARGYITGNMKNEEYFALAKRETTPQTVYKKQKLDRDDVIDIADLDVIAWLKAEMKIMLDEEIAGAILIGDGRSSGDEDKIRETNIRPIVSDSELYVTTAYVNLDDANSTIEELVDSAITSREFYKGSGLPTFYTSESVIAKFLTVKDGFGRRMYNSVSEIAQVLRVADVVPVDVLGRVPDVVGIMVNLADYTIGTDRGGQATMFDDFDLDFNKLRYLLETRISGALTTPKAALVFRKVASSSAVVSPDAPAFNATTGVLTVPTKTGVVYKNAAGTTLTTNAPVTVTDQTSPYEVFASPASASYYFADNAHDQWSYDTRD